MNATATNWETLADANRTLLRSVLDTAIEKASPVYWQALVTTLDWVCDVHGEYEIASWLDDRLVQHYQKFAGAYHLYGARLLCCESDLDTLGPFDTWFLSSEPDEEYPG